MRLPARLIISPKVPKWPSRLSLPTSTRTFGARMYGSSITRGLAWKRTMQASTPWTVWATENVPERAWSCGQWSVFFRTLARRGGSRRQVHRKACSLVNRTDGCRIVHLTAPYSRQMASRIWQCRISVQYSCGTCFAA